ncbi:hypothetical protein CTAM01_12162 [Colletotrichum tamarilloi]|uniref:Uncharacterized protein n=1 Tax=Colletotrichum tamarilloi TaxID=1209934 RepID=A0ABQ9QVI2_9PEZI|nr:uncharacterized protein CTAM01_12162 [Colletotrichum tamarilloi]KAK1486437.1 hypothetical protein CTAM01_12162 [Colletotrichum tamarilloi]
MIFFITRALTLLTLSTLTLAQDEPKGDGYTGIDTLNPIPDVYLNASVSVGEISIEVQNITAKVNLDAKVLNLLHFQAGVDASIDRVKLGIYNVSAKVELEARLENVVKMVDDVLTSIDLNPIIATLGDTVSDIVNKTVDVVTDPVESSAAASAVAKRDLTFRLEHNILYSVNDFSGRTHTNRVLAQNGSLFDVYLDNSGNESGRKVVGFYSRDMTFSGHNKTISIDGQVKEFELQYVYAPYPGLEAFSNIYLDTTGKVVRTKIVAEAEGGGTATISNDDESSL